MNGSKCQLSVFSESSTPYQPSTSLRAAGQCIPMTDSLRYLGVQFDPKMTWEGNTISKVQKARKMFGALNRKFGKILSRHHMLHVFRTKVVPIFMYGLKCCYPRLKSGQIALEKAFEYGVRTSLQDYRSTYDELLIRNELMPIEKSVRHDRLLLARGYIRHWKYIPQGTIHPLRTRRPLRPRFNDQSYVATTATNLRLRKSALEVMLDEWNKIPNCWLWKTQKQLKTLLKLHDDNGSYRNE